VCSYKIGESWNLPSLYISTSIIKEIGSEGERNVEKVSKERE
jgi:hypothetical protein